MAWRRPGDKPLSEPMMVSLPTHICVTWPQWVINAYVSLSLNKSNICMACLHVLSGTFFNTITHILEAWARFYSYHYYGNFVLIFMRGLMCFFLLCFRTLVQTLLNVLGASELISQPLESACQRAETNLLLIQEIFSNLPELPATKADGFYPVQIFYHGEITLLQAQIQMIRSQIQLLLKISQGCLPMDDHCREILVTLSQSKVPKAWLTQTFPSCPDLIQWARGFHRRIEVMTEYIQVRLLPCIFLGPTVLLWSALFRWFSARLWYFQCSSNGDTWRYYSRAPSHWFVRPSVHPFVRSFIPWCYITTLQSSIFHVSALHLVQLIPSYTRIQLIMLKLCQFLCFGHSNRKMQL